MALVCYPSLFHLENVTERWPTSGHDFSPATSFLAASHQRHTQAWYHSCKGDIFKTNHDKRSYDVKWWNTEFQIPKKTTWDSLSLGLHKFDGSSQHPNDVGCNLSICTWLSSETTLPEGWQGWPRLALLISEVVVPGCMVNAVSRFHALTRSGARSRAILSDHNEELVQTP